jgi:hypothetical protein
MENILAQFSGGAVNYAYGILSPVGFGRKTTLKLTETRVVETTKKFISSRYCEIRVSRIDSAEIVEQGMPWLIVLGCMTIALYGLGLIFFTLYFFIKNKYLLIHSGNNTIAVEIYKTKDLAIAGNFIQKVLDHAELISVNSRMTTAV